MRYRKARSKEVDFLKDAKDTVVSGIDVRIIKLQAVSEELML